MNYLWIICARNVVLAALLCCLLNVGVGHAMDDPQDSSLPKTTPELEVSQSTVIDDSSCFPSSCWLFKCSFKWPSNWKFCHKKNSILPGNELELYLGVLTDRVNMSSKKNESSKNGSGNPFSEKDINDVDGIDNGDLVQTYDDVNSTDYELTVCSKLDSRQSSSSIEEGCNIVYLKALDRMDEIENFSEASVSPVVDKTIIRILFVEDDQTLREFIKNVVNGFNTDSPKKYEPDLSKKYKIEYKIFTHGFFAVDYLLSSENFNPHIIVTDNNMESFYSMDSKIYADKKAGCELGKFLRVQRDDLGYTSIYSRMCTSIEQKGDSYSCVYSCIYSDEFADLAMKRFEGLIFLSTSDSRAEIGEANAVLFNGFPPKLKYERVFNKFLITSVRD